MGGRCQESALKVRLKKEGPRKNRDKKAREDLRGGNGKKREYVTPGRAWETFLKVRRTMV